MEALFLKTPQGLLPLSPEQCEKYKLEKGMYSPFNRFPVVDRQGDFSQKKRHPNLPLKEPKRDSRIFTTAETLDIAAGEDSKQV
jgi:hypothetical protein